MNEMTKCEKHGTVADHIACTHVIHQNLERIVFRGGRVLCPECAGKDPDLKEDELLCICKSCVSEIYDEVMHSDDTDLREMIVEYDLDDLVKFPWQLREMLETGTLANPAEREAAKIGLFVSKKSEREISP